MSASKEEELSDAETDCCLHGGTLVLTHLSQIKNQTKGRQYGGIFRLEDIIVSARGAQSDFCQYVTRYTETKKAISLCFQGRLRCGIISSIVNLQDAIRKIF